jgi:ABC-type dipeptide/oligopeptide/nickel transport system permease component
MARYTGRRLLLLIPQLLMVAVITFVLILFTPGNPARAQLGSQAPQEAVDALSIKLGLEEPAPQRFLIYLGDIAQGDFGQSWVSGRPVRDDLLSRAPATFELITIGFLCSLLVAIPLGIAGALRSSGLLGRLLDRVSYGYGLLAGAVPDFWFALILVFVFFAVLGVAPSPIGQLDVAVPAPDSITGMISVDALLTGNWPAFWNHAGHLVLPVATLVFINAAPILRMTRSSMLENLNSPYIRFARANGMPQSQIIRYALRNALLPIVTLAGVLYTILIGGAVLTETIFSWGGVGQYAVQSVLNADWAALQSVVLLGATVSLIVYLILDLMHAAVDPRVR